MGLFDFLKASQPHHSATVDDLLCEAVNHPATLPDFYRALLAEKLWLVTDANTFPKDKKVATEDTYFKLRVYENGALGMFTSPDRLNDNKAVQGSNLQFLMFPGRIALMKTRGNRIIINPYSEHSIILEPEEINELLQANLYIGNRNLTEKQPELFQNR